MDHLIREASLVREARGEIEESRKGFVHHLYTHYTYNLCSHVTGQNSSHDPKYKKLGKGGWEHYRVSTYL